MNRNIRVLIVGQGIAGSTLALQLHEKNIDFQLVDLYQENSSSRVAAGLINPVTGKRLVKTWMADTIFPFAFSFYKKWEDAWDCRFLFKKKIYKPYKDVAEQNYVIAKTADERYKDYIDIEAPSPDYQNQLHNSLGGYTLQWSGYLDTTIFLNKCRKMFAHQLDENVFQFENLKIEENHVQYKGHLYSHIIFADGYKAMLNPYFKWLPFSVTKGEMLDIEIPHFPKDRIVNKGGFILPQQEGHFTAGSTYDLTTDPSITAKGKQQLIDKLATILSTPYTILNQRAAIRPTVKDRRPFIGQHPKHKTIFIFNGLGTKGISLSPYFSLHLIESIFEGKILNKEVNIDRYYSLYYD